MFSVLNCLFYYHLDHRYFLFKMKLFLSKPPNFLKWHLQLRAFTEKNEGKLYFIYIFISVNIVTTCVTLIKLFL